MMEQEVLEGTALLVLEAPPQLLDDSEDLSYYFSSFLRSHEDTKASRCTVETVILNKDNIANFLEKKKGGGASDQAAPAPATSSPSVKDLAVVKFSNTAAVSAVGKLLNVTMKGVIQDLELRRGYLTFKHQTLFIECVVHTQQPEAAAVAAAAKGEKQEEKAPAVSAVPSPQPTPRLEPQKQQQQQQQPTRRSTESDFDPTAPPLTSTAKPPSRDARGQHPPSAMLQTPLLSMPLPPGVLGGPVVLFANFCVLFVRSGKARAGTVLKKDFKLTPGIIFEIFRGETYFPVRIVMLDNKSHKSPGRPLALIEMNSPEAAAEILPRFDNTIVELLGPGETVPEVCLHVYSKYSFDHIPKKGTTEADRHLDVPENTARALVLPEGHDGRTALPMGSRVWGTASNGEAETHRGADTRGRKRERDPSPGPSQPPPRGAGPAAAVAHPSSRYIQPPVFPNSNSTSSAGNGIPYSNPVPYVGAAATATTPVFSYPQQPPLHQAPIFSTVPSIAPTQQQQQPQQQPQQPQPVVSTIDALGPLPQGWRAIFSQEYKQTYYAYRDPVTGRESTTWERPRTD